ncbi:aromatic amino acid transport family protein [Arsenophonus symbiont of Ornithomya chloropus]|uniref:aromatic amino acid transport family protein n=1 Tax=Arsenophonus symbiont of Ornithomya chloropus TaxID=634121 RepID=UPI0032B29A5C
MTSTYKKKYINFWDKHDIFWILSLYGTAIGAGVLFLPINIGINGFLPLILMTLLSFPMVFFSHRGLTRFILSSSKYNNDITKAAEEYFGFFSGNLVTILYFFSIYPILLVYGISITNNVEHFIIQLLGYQSPPRWLLSLLLISSIISIVTLGEKYIIKRISILGFLFIIILVVFSFYMIPYWHISILKNLSFSEMKIYNSNNPSIMITVFFTIPVIVFAFNHSPIISTFVIANRKKYGEFADKKSSKILFVSHILMVLTVMFFVFSCMCTLSPVDLLRAKSENMNVLDYLSLYFDKPFIRYVSSFIAFIAIIKSFLGHYLGAREGCNSLIERIYGLQGKKINKKKINMITVIFMLITIWLVSTLNPNILNIIENLGGPIITVLLFIMPMYAIRKISVMNKYSGYFSNLFVVVIGMISILSTVYKLFL